jgi:hypothetical protein
MGSQVFWGLLGGHESVSTAIISDHWLGASSRIAGLLRLFNAGQAAKLKAREVKADMTFLSQATDSSGRSTDLQGVDNGSQSSPRRSPIDSARGYGQSELDR